MRRKGTWLVNSALLVCAVVAGVALCEVSLRILYPQPLGVWHHDREGLALHWPGRVTYLPQFGQAVSFNSVGMRDREHSVKKADGVFRILLLGDSFMEALQVSFEASFPSLLERALREKLARSVEIVNASVSGWGTDDELQYLETHGREWKPDLILVAMTLHNDVGDNLRQRFHTIRDGALVKTSRDRASQLDYWSVQLKSFLATRSHAYQLLVRARRAREMQAEARNLQAHVAELFREASDQDLERGLDLTALLLQRMSAIVSADGGCVVLVLLPLAIQLSDRTLARL